MTRRKDRQRRHGDAAAHARPGDPPHPAVLALSEGFAPPRVNLRQAEILDACGDASSATHHVSHSRPWDVMRADLDAYPDAWTFMDPTDLLFYLWPVATEYERDPTLTAVDMFVPSLDRCVPELLPQLDAPQRAALAEGVAWLRGDHGDHNLVFGCANLESLLMIAEDEPPVTR